ncbi:hypothetical protein GCM10007304_06600 [Rhodococcoides trifolii]|uniref:Uncharacterized protein n=1 Tax=Rhodococcoides trifolii TaxID=908250 RepID=A0A917CRH5_9NOCA|nr:hypothetical protein [Rhodococcus trifolii]GGF95424.1 hypothetical protein GCM10007304_06600 [Rhodococcus trifolii]
MASSTAPTVLGIGLAATGAAHFVAPDAFAGITSAAFPKDVRTWTYRNGATELAVGTAIAIPQTRKLGFVALAGYVGFLGYRAYTAR